MTDKLNPPKLPVCFMLDELATLGHLPAIENAVGLSAGYGIQACMSDYKIDILLKSRSVQQLSVKHPVDFIAGRNKPISKAIYRDNDTLSVKYSDSSKS